MSRTCASVTIDHRLTQPAGRPDAADLVVATGRFNCRRAQLHAAHGPREAARLFAKVLGHLDTYGAAVAVPALITALAMGTPLLLALTPARASSDRVALDAV